VSFGDDDITDAEASGAVGAGGGFGEWAVVGWLCAAIAGDRDGGSRLRARDGAVAYEESGWLKECGHKNGRLGVDRDRPGMGGPCRAGPVMSVKSADYADCASCVWVAQGGVRSTLVVMLFLGSWVVFIVFWLLFMSS